MLPLIPIMLPLPTMLPFIPILMVIKFELTFSLGGEGWTMLILMLMLVFMLSVIGVVARLL